MFECNDRSTDRSEWFLTAKLINRDRLRGSDLIQADLRRFLAKSLPKLLKYTWVC